MYLIYPQSIVCTIFFNFFFYWFIYRRFIQIQISSIYIAMLFLTSCILNLFNHRKRKMKIKIANYYNEMISLFVLWFRYVCTSFLNYETWKNKKTYIRFRIEWELNWEEYFLFPFILFDRKDASKIWMGKFLNAKYIRQSVKFSFFYFNHDILQAFN